MTVDFLKIRSFFKQRYFWTCSAVRFNLIFAAGALLLYNQVFFNKIEELGESCLFQTLTFICFAALFNLAANLLFFKYTLKPLTILILLMNGVVYYFMVTFNIAVDKIMLLNVLETDKSEAADLFNMAFVADFLFFGVVPAWLVYKTKIIYAPPSREIWYRLLMILFSLAVAAGLIFGNFKYVAQFSRNNRYVKYYLLPVNYIGAVISAVKIKWRANRPLVKIGEDAKFDFNQISDNKKNLIVLVVGETARAANFSLNGYERDTNEPLEPFAADLINYPKVKACGTSTAISVPCMFAADNAQNFSASRAAYTENLLDIMQRAGYKVWWRENNSGCKGVCNRVETEVLCKGGHCLDAALVQGLAQKIEETAQNQVVVLHQQGSHGPAYYLRYRPESERFMPACETERLDLCSQQEIINAYDNSIYETSLSLAEIIEVLKQLQSKYHPILIYASDHGESLGENGIYLHAAPYVIAPDTQTHIPFLMWLPDDTAKAWRVDKECLLKNVSRQYSHDNLFHSVLGIGGVTTALYDKSLDIFAACRLP